MHMRQIVLDINAGAPGLFDPAHEFDHFPHFGDAKRRGRLVQHDEVGVVVHRPADGDALTFAARQIADRRIDGDANAAEADDVDQDLLGDFLSRLMSMKPNRFVICLPTKKLRHRGCFSASDLS